MQNNFLPSCGGSSAGQSSGFLNRRFTYGARRLARIFGKFLFVLALCAGVECVADTVQLTAKASAAIDAIVAAGPGRQAAVLAPTGSMLPALTPASVAIVAPRAYADLRPGDIIVFTDGVQTVSHRIYKKFRQGCTTKGDALPAVDPKMTTERNYLGLVVIASVDKISGEVTMH